MTQTKSIDYNNLIVDYADGDVAIFDHVNDLSKVYPSKPMTNLIAMCTSGSLTLRVNHAKVVVRTNDILFCPPTVRIEDFSSSADFECTIICLADHFIQALLHDKITIWNHAVYVNELNVIAMSDVCRREIGYYYDLICSKIENHKAAPPYEIVLTLIRALLLELCFILESRHGRAEEEKLSQGKMLFNRFLGLLSANSVKRQPISQYASQLAITPKYLTMLCLKYSDKTASEWIIQYTTEDIRFYLKNSNLSIKEISAKLGFANMSHFGSYVRKHLGMSPSDFRHHRNFG